MKKLITSIATFALFLATSNPVFAGKPLKVFILVGQSNMEGHAQTKTFPAIAKDPKTLDMYKKMVDSDGKPVVCENVWISDSYGNFSGDPIGKKHGKLTAGYGSQHHVGTGKIGPEFTFGIYMNELLKEPVLIIKTAWGGKSLMVDFRPPSAGALPDSANEKTKKAAGKNYKLMIDHVKEVLADPKKVCPVYNPKDGYELAGLVWFQGFNDLVGSYPRKNPKKGKKSTKDYSEYSRLLSCFIRDVRKDLKAPDMPVVVGVLGVGGENTSESTIAFRKAMAAPAETDEFKNNVFNVFTEKYWPEDIDAAMGKAQKIKNEYSKELRTLKMKSKKKEISNSEYREKSKKINDQINAKIKETLTEDELYLINDARSNQGFHYFGSAKCLGQIGKAFAEALVSRQQPRK